MLNTILGFKQKMGTVYLKDRIYPVTWVKVDPCVVTQIKHTEKDKYMAVQLGTGSKKNVNLTKPLQGHLKVIQNSKVKSKNTSPRFLREIKVTEESDLKVGENVKLSDVLQKGDMVTVTGTSKGKGFAGGVKRWGFHGGPKTHGQSDRERAPGSIGQRTTPGRVYKGKHMAGRMGMDRVTVKSLVVVDIDEKNNLVAITGAVPGVNGGLVFVKKTGESRLKAQINEEIKKTENEESIDSAQDKQEESIEKKSPSVQGSGETKEEIKKEENKKLETEETKNQGNEEPKNLTIEEQKDSKAEKEEVEKEAEVTK
jgi:large subunit ribosomal protein L3